MCELFGVNSDRRIYCNALLRDFYSHGADNPDGWGLAAFCGGGVSLEKEPVSSLESIYLKNRLTDRIVESVLIAHIRKASVGKLEYKNTHPFALRDSAGRLWTLAHNGTIFKSRALDPYRLRQNGESDSERILYYLVDRINAAQADKPEGLSGTERCAVVSDVVRTITPYNKVNLLIYDGDLFYVHVNHQDSLYRWQDGNTLVISTKPLNQGRWELVPLNTVLAYRSGRLVYTGDRHPNEYVKPKST